MKNSKSIFKPIKKFSRTNSKFQKYYFRCTLSVPSFRKIREPFTTQKKSLQKIFCWKSFVKFFDLEHKCGFFSTFRNFLQKLAKFQKIILSKLHIKKKIIKIGAPFYFPKTPNFRDKSGFFSNWNIRNPKCSKFQKNHFV